MPLEDDLTQCARVLAESCFAVHNVMVAKILYYKTCQRMTASDGILFSNSAIRQSHHHLDGKVLTRFVRLIDDDAWWVVMNLPNKKVVVQSHRLRRGDAREKCATK